MQGPLVLLFAVMHSMQGYSVPEHLDTGQSFASLEVVQQELQANTDGWLPPGTLTAALSTLAAALQQAEHSHQTLLQVTLLCVLYAWSLVTCLAMYAATSATSISEHINASNRPKPRQMMKQLQQSLVKAKSGNNSKLSKCKMSSAQGKSRHCRFQQMQQIQKLHSFSRGSQPCRVKCKPCTHRNMSWRAQLMQCKLSFTSLRQCCLIWLEPMRQHIDVSKTWQS